MNAQTIFQTENAQRYLGTMCKHFGHKVPVQVEDKAGQITFPFGKCDLKADETSLQLSIDTDNQADLDKAIKVVTSHLERFAFRESPTLEWK